jgi:hypothetical protein
VFEVGGGGIREEIAKEGLSLPVSLPKLTTSAYVLLAIIKALRLASAKLPGPTEFISTSTPPRLGSIADATSISASLPRSSTAAGLAPASLLSSGARPEMGGSVLSAVQGARARSTFAGAQRQDPMTGEVISLPDLDVSSHLKTIVSDYLTPFFPD